MNEENKLRKFKLIDKEGYLRSHTQNGVILEYYGGGEVVEGYLDSEGELVNYLVCNQTLITKFEFKYFEEVTSNEETPPIPVTHYWQQGTPLKAGHIVGKNCSGDNEYTVKYIGDTYAVLSDKRKETTSAISNLRSLVKSDKDVVFEKVLSAWKGTSIEGKLLRKDSVVRLGDLFDVMYTVMKGETL